MLRLPSFDYLADRFMGYPIDFGQTSKALAIRIAASNFCPLILRYLRHRHGVSTAMFRFSIRQRINNLLPLMQIEA